MSGIDNDDAGVGEAAQLLDAEQEQEQEGQEDGDFGEGLAGTTAA
ncbi:MAG: hypothetical protein ACRD04_08230 [Terriglobales bacterium]